MSKSTPHAKRVPSNPKNSKKSKTVSKKRAKHVRAASIVPEPKPGTPQFAKLQREWYKKLADSGFKDLENHMKHTGEAYPLLHGHAYSALQGPRAEETLHYYRRWTCYMAHINVRRLKQPKRDILEAWANGATMLQIQTKIGPKYNQKGFSNGAIHNLIKYMEPIVAKWNRTSTNGLDYIEPRNAT